MRARDLCVYIVLAAGALGLGCGGCLSDDEAAPATEVEPCVGGACEDAGPGGTNNGFDRDVGGDVRNICEGQECECLIGEEGGFCRTEHCGVVVEPGILDGTETIGIREITAPGAFRGDLLSNRACELSALLRKPNGPLQVSVGYDPDELPVSFVEEEVVGVHLTPRFTLAQDSVLDQQRDRVSFGVLHGGVTVGATVLPREPRVRDVVGTPRFDVHDAETYILNISQHTFGATFFDGQRFYAANGPRVFIWNDGVPADPTTPPDVILGRPSLEDQFMLASASAFSGTARAIWTDGEKLLVAEGHRVLIWSTIPESDFAPADLVLGQDDYHGFLSNSGERTANAAGLSSPRGLWSDGERLVVADTMNHRFLVWNSFPRVVGQPADLVIGQPAFDTSVPGTGQINAYQAWDSYFDGSRLALASRFACECFHVLDGFPTTSNPAADYTVGLGYPLNQVGPTTFGNGSAMSGFGANGVAFLNAARVSAWFDFPDASRPADITLGKPDDTIGGVLGNVNSASFAALTPYGDVWSNEDYLFVGDGHRLLVWKGLPSSTFEAADMVIGQPSFATEIPGIDYRGVGRKRVAQPANVASAGEITVIADRANNRAVVIRGSDPFSAETVVILGQADGSGYFPNRLGAPSAATMNTPVGVYTDGTRIAVADSGNHRVLIWNTIPTIDGTPADVVLGQSDFAAMAQNAGNTDADGDGDIDADAGSLHFPAGVHFDGISFYVADQYNHRVLAWDGMPSASGEPADYVLGQPDFEANEPNRGLGWYAVGADTLSRPMDVATTDDGQVLVSDAQNSRVLVFDSVGATSEASAVIGQPDFVSNVSPEYYSGTNTGIPIPDSAKKATAHTLRLPASIDWSGGTLFVADAGNHRVVQFPALSTNVGATRVWGQPDFVTRANNEDTVSAGSLKGPQGVATGPGGRLMIADTDNHRLLQFDGGRLANAVFGQTMFHENGINGASPALDAVSSPGGIALEPSAEQLWVTDTANHRVVLYEGSGQKLVLGQQSVGGSAVNGGLLEPAAWTFAQPTDVWTNGVKLVVADRGNHRVLIWNSIPATANAPADVVVGQPDFASNRPNAGAIERAGRDTLFAPEGVYVDAEGKLFVSDTGNNRVLMWDRLPSANGASADSVLCQEDFFGNEPNMGTGVANAASCAGPTDVVRASGGLWVADSRNNRVLRFEANNLDGGVAATLVLGQATFTERLPGAGSDIPSAANLSNPARVEYDGRNLYVVDRGHNRVLIWNPIPTQSYTPASQVLGHKSFDTAAAAINVEGMQSPFGVAVHPLEYNSARVWVSDRDRDRVVVFDHVGRRF